jgi:hypothetical protein
MLRSRGSIKRNVRLLAIWQQKTNVQIVDFVLGIFFSITHVLL